MKNILITSICAAAISLAACGTSEPLYDNSARENAAQDVDIALNNYVTKWAGENDFNGVIMVRRAGQNDYTYVHGLADLPRQTKLTQQSAFQTGSIDKLFASAAIFSMADDGLIDLDAPITTYLPNYRADTGDRITVAHLLTNRSGLPDDYRPLIGGIPKVLEKNPHATDAELGINMTLAQGIEAYGQGDLTAEPGAEFNYGLTNWIIVHHLIETVSGNSYGDVLKARIFEPAGMTRSGIFNMMPDANEVGDYDFAIGYDSEDDYYKGDFPMPAMIGGGTFTNSADLLNFLEAVYSGKIISAHGLERFNAITTPDENYAYGGRLTTYVGQPEALYSWQSGSNGATNVVAIHALDGSYSFVAMSNRAQDQDDLRALSRNVETFRQ